MSYTIFGTDLWATHVVLGGYLVPVGTLLLTPAVYNVAAAVQQISVML